MLQQQLLKSGVPEDAIEVISLEVEAVDAALERAGEGDLVMIFGDDIDRCWQQISGYHDETGDGNSESQEPVIQSFVEEDPEAFTLETGSELIRDERGVRIARIDEDSD